MRSWTVLGGEAKVDWHLSILFLCIERLLVFILRFPSQAYLYLPKVRVHRTASLLSLLPTTHAHLSRWTRCLTKVDDPHVFANNRAPGITFGVDIPPSTHFVINSAQTHIELDKS